MKRKPKLAVVAGEVRHPRFIARFEALAERFDVTIHALADDRIVDRHGTRLRLRLFEPLADMPGYLRGLEEELADADGILGVETSRLGTFQAVRAARRHGIPFGVVVSEFHPYFYERYQNIRAIQYDIRNKADRFFATSQAAASTLLLDGAPEPAISVVPPVVDARRFRPDAALRQKFRRYIGLSDTDLVVTYQQDLEAWNRPELALEAFLKVQKSAGVMARRMKLLLVGNGTMAKELKYRCVDAGAGRSVLFLHQDPEPFLGDMYAASDVMITPRALVSEFHEDLPWAMLESMAAGVVPVVGAGSVAAEFAAEAGVVFADDTVPQLAATLQRLVMDPVQLESFKAKAMSRIETGFAPSTAAAPFLKEVEALVFHESTRGGDAERLAHSLESIDRDLREGREDDALIKTEELRTLGLKSPKDQAEILCRKAEALYALSRLEDATNVYSDAMKLDDKNPRCLRGLGYLAWQGHSNEEALMFFRRAHALRDDDSETMLGIGLVYRRLGLTEEAVFWLEKCIERHDFPPAAIAALAQTCAQAHRTDYAIKVLERAIESVGDQKMLLMTLGQLYLTEGLAERGNELLKRALAETA